MSRADYDEVNRGAAFRSFLHCVNQDTASARCEFGRKPLLNPELRARPPHGREVLTTESRVENRRRPVPASRCLKRLAGRSRQGQHVRRVAALHPTVRGIRVVPWSQPFDRVGRWRRCSRARCDAKRRHGKTHRPRDPSNESHSYVEPDNNVSTSPPMLRHSPIPRENS